MKLIKIIGYMVMTAMAISCGGGDGGDGLSDREFKQDVTYISYLMKSASVDIQLQSANGSVEHSVKQLTFAPDESKDKIERVIDGADFVLKVNGTKADIKISSVGNVQHSTNSQSGNSACRLSGNSSISGQAMALSLVLDWQLNVEIQGDNCTEQLRPDFEKFITHELSGLPFNSVKDLLNAADRQYSSAKRLDIRLHLEGEGR